MGGASYASSLATYRHARLPLLTALVPHVGGPIVAPGEPTVLIEFLPAARMTDMVTCVGPPDVIMMGSPTVLIGFLMAARMGDPTAHGGTIVLGAPTVMIGEAGMGSPGAVVVTPPARRRGWGRRWQLQPGQRALRKPEQRALPPALAVRTIGPPGSLSVAPGRRGYADGGSGHEVCPGTSAGLGLAERNGSHRSLPGLTGPNQCGQVLPA